MFIAPDTNKKIWGPAGYGKSRSPFILPYRHTIRKEKIEKIFNVRKEIK